MKRVLIFALTIALAVSCLCGCTAAQRLEQAVTDAKAAIPGAYDPESYYPEELAAIDQIVADYTAALDAAAGEEELPALAADFAAKLDEVSTKEEVDEAMDKLADETAAAFFESAHNRLVTYETAEEYLDALEDYYKKEASMTAAERIEAIEALEDILGEAGAPIKGTYDYEGASLPLTVSLSENAGGSPVITVTCDNPWSDYNNIANFSNFDCYSYTILDYELCTGILTDETVSRMLTWHDAIITPYENFYLGEDMALVYDGEAARFEITDNAIIDTIMSADHVAAFNSTADTYINSDGIEVDRYLDDDPLTIDYIVISFNAFSTGANHASTNAVWVVLL